MGAADRGTTSWLAGARVLVCGNVPGRVGAVACELARAGATIVLPRRQEQPNAWRDTVRAIGSAGSVPLEMGGDLATVEGIEAFVRQSVRAVGRIDGLVCDAEPVPAGGLDSLEEPGWSRGLRDGLKQPFFLAKAVGLSMVESDGGRIVIVADGARPTSQEGSFSRVMGEMRVMMAQVLARALAPRVSICAVIPEWKTAARWSTLARQVRCGLEEGGLPGVIALG